MEIYILIIFIICTIYLLTTSIIRKINDKSNTIGNEYVVTTVVDLTVLSVMLVFSLIVLILHFTH